MPTPDSRFSFPGRTTLGELKRSAWGFFRERRVRRENRAIAERARNGTLLFLYNSQWHGLFAHLATCLQLANWARAQQRRVVFACIGGSYRIDGQRENWLPEILLQPGYDAPCRRAELEKNNVVCLSTSFLAFPYWRDRVPPLTLNSGRRLFYQTFQLAPAVVGGVDDVARDWPKFFMIGLHYRGTDKKREASPVDYEIAIQQVRKIIAELSQHGIANVRVFVATDDTHFLQKTRAAFGALIFTRENVTRSADGHPIHLGTVATGDNRLAVDAMIDAMLLSRCAILVRTASFLSGFSAMLAERQLVFMLNRPYRKTTWFPDSEVLKTSACFENCRPALTAFLRAVRFS